MLQGGVQDRSQFGNVSVRTSKGCGASSRGAGGALRRFTGADTSVLTVSNIRELGLRVRARPGIVSAAPRLPPPSLDCAPLRTRLACVCCLPCLPEPRARATSHGPLRGRIRPAGRVVGPARHSAAPRWCTKCTAAAVFADVCRCCPVLRVMGRTEGDGVTKAIAASLRGQGLHEPWVQNVYAPRRALRSHSHRSPCSAILWRALRAYLAEPPAATGPTLLPAAAAPPPLVRWRQQLQWQLWQQQQWQWQWQQQQQQLRQRRHTLARAAALNVAARREQCGKAKALAAAEPPAATAVARARPRRTPRPRPSPRRPRTPWPR